MPSPALSLWVSDFLSSLLPECFLKMISLALLAFPMPHPSFSQGFGENVVYSIAVDSPVLLKFATLYFAYLQRGGDNTREGCFFFVLAISFFFPSRERISCYSLICADTGDTLEENR